MKLIGVRQRAVRTFGITLLVVIIYSFSINCVAHAAEEPSSCDLRNKSDCSSALAAARGFNDQFDAGKLYKIWDDGRLCSFATDKLSREQFAAAINGYRVPMGASITERELFSQQIDFLDPSTNRLTYIRSYKLTASVGNFYEYLGLVKENGGWKVCNYNFAIAPKE